MCTLGAKDRGQMIICKLSKQICPYQYFCNQRKDYVFSDRVKRCLNYKETKNQ